MNIFRHGDINLHKVDEIKGEVVSHKGSYVVAEGETTGHKHLLKVKNPDNLIIRKDEFGHMYFELKEVGTITHEEHKVIEIPAGIYKEVREREVDHFADGLVRKVID